MFSMFSRFVATLPGGTLTLKGRRGGGGGEAWTWPQGKTWGKVTK